MYDRLLARALISSTRSININDFENFYIVARAGDHIYIQVITNRSARAAMVRTG